MKKTGASIPLIKKVKSQGKHMVTLYHLIVIMAKTGQN
jgi:hypothetical protein